MLSEGLPRLHACIPCHRLSDHESALMTDSALIESMSAGKALFRLKQVSRQPSC